MVRAGSVGVLAALATVPGPLRDALDGTALAADGEISPANLATYLAAVEAVCSHDGKTPPPERAGRFPQPSAADAGRRFATTYRTAYPGFRQNADVVLPFAEQGPRTAPPLGAVSAADLLAYGGRSFTELDVGLRLRLLRSWLADHDRTPLDPTYASLGIPDVGTLHRAVVLAAIQLATLAYFADPRTWQPVRYGGPWLGRDHEGEELPFSHAGHEIYDIDFGLDAGASKL